MDPLIRLKKENFPKQYSDRGEPTVTVYDKGRIYFNKFAVEHLSLLSPEGQLGGVSFFQNPKDASEFAVTSDNPEWMVRPGAGCGVEFNNKNLACHIIDTVWDHIPHAAGSKQKRPGVMSFRVAHLPMDDNANKNIFALICKKKYL